MELWDQYIQWTESDFAAQIERVVIYILLSIPVLLYLIHLLDCVHRIAADVHKTRGIQQYSASLLRDQIRLQEEQVRALEKLVPNDCGQRGF